jgi:recombination protein RecR
VALVPHCREGDDNYRGGLTSPLGANRLSELDTLIQLLAKLPGLGPRSARRAALHLIKRRESLLTTLASAMAAAADAIRPCSVCGNLDTIEPCAICRDPERDDSVICVVEDLADLWALERTGAFRGRYHVLGGTLSALDGVGPEDLAIDRLVARLRPGQELILALNATVEGQTTAHYLADRVAGSGVRLSRLAQGVPIGGELDYLDDGTLTAALRARRAL